MQLAVGLAVAVAGLALLAYTLLPLLQARQRTAPPRRVLVDGSGVRVTDGRGATVVIAWDGLLRVTARSLDGGPWRDEVEFEVAGRGGVRTTIGTWDPSADAFLAGILERGADPRRLVAMITRRAGETAVLLDRGATGQPPAM